MKLSILYFGDQWDDAWRRRQELAAGLAESEEVASLIYVELPLTVTSLLKCLLGRADRDARRRWKRLLSSGPVFRVGGIAVVTPIALLPRVSHPRLQAINARLHLWVTRRLIGRLRRRLETGITVLWASHPHYTTDMLGIYGEKLLCYDNSDHFSFIGPCLGASPKVMEVFASSDRQLTEGADLVFVNSDVLYREKRELNSRTYLLLNGVNLRLLQVPPKQGTEAPADMVDMRRPILGYVGHLGDTVDLALLERVAVEHPDCSVVMIGGIDLEPAQEARLRRQRNLFFVGDKPLTSLSQYISQFDVGLSLYKPCYLNDTRCSLKILDYLALGKPVVSTNTAGAHHFADVIQIARDHEEFLAKIHDALVDDDPGAVERRIAFVSNWTWEDKVEYVLDRMMIQLEETRLLRGGVQSR